MRRLLTLLACALGAGLWAQTTRSADEWLTAMFNAYSQPLPAQQKATVSVVMTTSRNPQGEVIQRFVYTYTLEAPAKLNLTVQNTLMNTTTRVQSDGQRLTVQAPNRQPQEVLIANSGLALLEQLVAQDVVPTYDMVFVFGGKTKQEEFRKQVSQLKIVSEDEKQVVITGKIRNERNRDDDLRLVLDKATARLRVFQVTTQVKIEGTDGAFTLLMEFEPQKMEPREPIAPTKP
ncbi:MAG: hypothetical protein K6U12_08870 [Armatimonadetes bacterium]|nr:hypothetical protein [Armatimonadota bacterium]CUU38042.1 hypothetical protein DCOP10_123109 [Armatimonadetes bacterium DC]